MTQDSLNALTGAFIIGAILMGVVWLGTYIWYAVGLSRVFTKLGAESWRAWVPILNEMEILSRGGVPAWSVVYSFIPILNVYWLYLHVVATHRINVQFGKGAGMTALAVFFPPIWSSVLGFGRNGAGATAATRVEKSSAAAVAVDAAPSNVDASGYSVPSINESVMPTLGSDWDAQAPRLDVVEPHQSAAAPADEPEAPKLISNPWAPVSQPSDAAPAFVPPPIVPAPAPAAPPAPTPPLAAPPAPVPPAPAPVDPEPVAPAPVEPAPVAPAPVEPAAEPAAEPAPEKPVLSAPPVATPATAEPDVAETIISAAPPAVEDDDDDYATIVVDRRPQIAWSLILDDGRIFALTANRVEVGRKPDPAAEGTQILAITDSTRTLSKTHAVLELDGDAWKVTDLNSTNGVLVVDSSGAEELLPSGGTAAVPGRFILGKVGMHCAFEEGTQS
jgi:hypothetical protein